MNQPISSEVQATMSNSQDIDSKAFEILVREHHRRIMAFAISLVQNPNVAEELVQDAFVTAYDKLSSFESNRDFGAWVRGIVRNKYREWARSRKEKALSPDIIEAIDEQHNFWDKHSDSTNNAITALRDCLKKLPDLLKETVECFYIKQLSGSETAKELDANESVIRKRLQRGREQLSLCVRETMEVKHV